MKNTNVGIGATRDDVRTLVIIHQVIIDSITHDHALPRFQDHQRPIGADHLHHITGGIDHLLPTTSAKHRRAPGEDVQNHAATTAHRPHIEIPMYRREIDDRVVETPDQTRVGILVVGSAQIALIEGDHQSFRMRRIGLRN